MERNDVHQGGRIFTDIPWPDPHGCCSKVKKVIENMRKKMRIQGWKDFEKMKDEQMAKEEKGAGL